MKCCRIPENIGMNGNIYTKSVYYIFLVFFLSTFSKIRFVRICYFEHIFAGILLVGTFEKNVLKLY